MSLVFLLALTACEPPTEEPAAPPDDTDAPEVDPAAPADPANPYAGCVQSARGWWTEADEDAWYSTQTYHADGHWSVYRYDGDVDGEFEEGESATWDDAGRFLVWEMDDDDRNDAADGRQTHTYGDDGLLAHYTWDNNADGSEEILFTVTHDDAGRRVRLERDEYQDGRVEWAWLTTWTPEGEGTTERLESDEDVDGVIDATELRHWSADGLLLDAAYDNDADGVPEYVYAYEYDTAGVRTGYLAQVYDAGVLDYDFHAVELFDAWGRDAGRNLDYYLDGPDDYAVRKEYDCTGWD